MDQTALELLKRLFEKSPDWVILADKSWKPVWSNRPVDDVPAVGERLLLPASHWEPAERPFFFHDTLYHCCTFGMEDKGLRVLELRPVLRDRFDLELMSRILQPMIVSCTGIFHELDETQARDLHSYLNTMMGGILRIYRMTYIEKELRRGEKGEWTQELFSLKSVLQPVAEETRRLMQHFAAVTYECGEQPMFVRGDLAGFRAAFLAGAVQCFRKPECEQSVRLTLHRNEDKAERTVTVRPESEPRRGLEGQLRDFGDLTQEKFLLEQYCAAFHIQSAFSEQDGAVTFRMELDLAEPGTVIQFRSPAVRASGSYFDPISVMLARIRFREYF